MRAAIRRWRDQVGGTHVLGAARVVLGMLLLVNALRAARALQAGYFGDVFHWPLLPEAMVPSRRVYVLVVAAQIALALLVVIGRRAGLAMLASATLGTYVLCCDRLQFHHNRWALFCYAALLAFAPCDRSFRPFARAGHAVGPLWAARLAQVQVSLVYLASGGSKLLDPDWRQGRVLLERLRLYGSQALDAGVPRGVVEWVSQPEVASALARLAIGSELFLVVGLWLPRTRVLALWWGVWFHLTIEVTSRVEGFTWLTLAMYALFVTPDVRGRTVFYDASRPRARLLARLVALLDWFARFDVKAEGRLFVVTDRTGRRSTGIGAVAAVARCTPLLFPLWAPLALLARVTRT